jgi:curved DNA-binding protein CbpA
MSLSEALEILELTSANITLAELKSRYRQKAQQVHPDKGGSSQDFISVRKAFTTIRDYLIGGKKETYSKQNRNQQESYEYKKTEQTQEDFWKTKYQQTYAELTVSQKRFEEIFGQLKNYESQINRIIVIFNSGQKLLQVARQNLQAKLQKLDEVFESEQQKIKSKYEKTWLDMLLNRQKMDKFEYVKLNNHLVSQINDQESKLIRSYHQEIEAIYQELMSQIYSTLSES